MSERDKPLNPINPEENPHENEKSEQGSFKEKLKKEQEKALNLSKLSKAELMHEIEDREIKKDSLDMDTFMFSNENPEGQQDNKDTPEYKRLQEVFRKIQTDHIRYPFFQKFFPNFIKIGEQARLGKNLPLDIVFLAVGIVESLLSSAQLAVYLFWDTLMFAISPIKTYRDTLKKLDENVV